MNSEIPVAKVLIQDRREEKFLVVKDRETQKWELPGGKIEDSEDRFEAGKREVEEELDIEVEDLEDVVRVEVEDDETVNCWILFTKIGKRSLDIDLFEEELLDWKWVEPEAFRDMNWHADAGYGLPAMVYLEDYLN